MEVTELARLQKSAFESSLTAPKGSHKLTFPMTRVRRFQVASRPRDGYGGHAKHNAMS